MLPKQVLRFYMRSFSQPNQDINFILSSLGFMGFARFFLLEEGDLNPKALTRAAAAVDAAFMCGVFAAVPLR